jgi:aspartate dehydrogenase
VNPVPFEGCLGIVVIRDVAPPLANVMELNVLTDMPPHRPGIDPAVVTSEFVRLQRLAMQRHSKKTRPLRVAFLGFGAINQRVLSLLRTRASAVEIVAAIVRKSQIAEVADHGLIAITKAARLHTLLPRPDMIIEAAGRDAVAEWGTSALCAADRFVVSSTSALTDDVLLRDLIDTARKHGSQLVISPGAIAGVDGLAAASRLGLEEVRHRIVKPPESWAAASKNYIPEADGGKPITIFLGSAREAATRFPLNANVAVTSALSGIGLDKTLVELVSDSSINANRHEVNAKGAFGQFTIQMENRPLKANAKSSELAALALVRIAENEVSDFVT